MRRLYYVVEKELQNIDGFEETTGNKTVTTYSCRIDEYGFPCIEREFDIELSNEDNSIDGIKDYLVDNYGLEDDINEFVFTQL